MLERSFIHVPGIGPHRERELWLKGFTDWGRFRAKHPAGPLRERILERLTLERAARELPGRESWRLYGTFRDRTAFLDIETDGAFEGCTVTCVGLADAHDARAFLVERDLRELPAVLERYDALVTFNGAQFDLPVLRREFPDADWDRLHHIDLRFPLRRLGFRGGLKRIERELGIVRGDGLAGVDGFTAVLLWQAHRNGHPRAMETLARYCLEDTVNLLPLMVEVYNRMSAGLPIDVPPLPRPATPPVFERADPELIHALLGRARWAGSRPTW